MQRNTSRVATVCDFVPAVLFGEYGERGASWDGDIDRGARGRRRARTGDIA